MNAEELVKVLIRNVETTENVCENGEREKQNRKMKKKKEHTISFDLKTWNKK